MLGPNARHIDNFPVKGAMYLHHSYPKLYKPDTRTADNLNPFRQELVNEHWGEVWRLDQEHFAAIRMMELAEGYVDEMITTGSGPAHIFWMPWEKFDGTDIPIHEYSYKTLPEDVREFLTRNMPDKPYNET